jgi:hypothetical protein
VTPTYITYTLQQPQCMEEAACHCPRHARTWPQHGALAMARRGEGVGGMAAAARVPPESPMRGDTGSRRDLDLVFIIQIWEVVLLWV